MRCLVIANAVDADSGFVGERLRYHGFTMHEGHREHPRDWPQLEGHDLVLTLGSDWSVYDPGRADSVEAESGLLRAAIEAGVPVFCICFGSQLLAHALGALVTRATRPEVGWHMIDSDISDVVPPGPWLQWHYDVFAVPESLQCRARSASGAQVLTGRRVLGTQFHPEATETMLARWSCGSGASELERMGLDRGTFMEQTRIEVDSSRQRCERLVDWFMETIAHQE